MENIYLRVKGIIKQDDKYLLIKRWVDDRIPDPDFSAHGARSSIYIK